MREGAGEARSKGATPNAAVTVRGKSVAGSDSLDGKDTAGAWTSALETSPNHHPSAFK